ncbi:uncharacterized protein PGRI_055210 [Penicillium griseofulvum]|uniref:Protein kinase domain-containing protein n=1 Tax=Penicillium patulum TaxID=5078 RepID=A0A135LCH1_PENPA|nr:uncharacterized protein PGRI_055210 [Penicillium griseofulvum]KXG46665.1 hypothetical protein PGRI_055210 [Penicillium griseofulvum]
MGPTHIPENKDTKRQHIASKGQSGLQWKKLSQSCDVNLKKERQAREGAERREEEERLAREEAERREEEERLAREETERELQPNNLFRLLDRCHDSLSQAIRVETDATLTTQGNATDPVNRLYPKRIVPWPDFPQLQEQVWSKFDRTAAFTSRLLFPTDTQIDYVATNIQNNPIYSETSLRNFDLGQMSLQDTQTPQRPATLGVEEAEEKREERRRDRRMALHENAIDAPTNSVCILWPMNDKYRFMQWNLARDVIDQEGDTFEFYATCLVAAVVTQIFSYMIDSGVQYGYICTGEAFVFLHIPEDDPTVVQYFMCIPNQDVQADDELRLHRTAIGQVLAFTLQALAAEAPSQEWHDAAHDKLKTWEVEYLDVLRKIPETLRKDPRASNYRPSHWKLEPKTHNTRSRARCKPDMSTPKHSSTEGSGSDEELHSPSIAAAARSRSSRGRGNNRQSTKESESTRAGKQTSRKDGQSTRPYCTIACIRGIVNREPLDKECPNWKLHGGQRHSIRPQEFTRRLHRQFARNRNHGFEQLHVCGRTGNLIKATLLSHGYTVVIKATTMEKQHRLQAEANNYRHLRSLQGNQIPVCLGTFTPRVSYWYHGELMAQMMILSWAGKRLQHVINDENSRFFHQERDKALTVLRSHGVVHGDSEWRNMLWDDLGVRLFVIDLEEVKWLKRPRALEPTSGNMRHGHRVGVRKSRKKLLSSSTAVCS